MFLVFRFLAKHSNAVVELQTARPVCMELFKDNKVLGRIMLRYGGKTIAAGVITEVGNHFTLQLSIISFYQDM